MAQVLDGRDVERDGVCRRGHEVGVPYEAGCTARVSQGCYVTYEEQWGHAQRFSILRDDRTA